MKVIYDRVRYLIEDLNIKIQQLEANDVVLPLKGHSEWLQSIQRDMASKIDAQLKSLLTIYFEKLQSYNSMLRSRQNTTKSVIEARDRTMKALSSYQQAMKGK